VYKQDFPLHASHSGGGGGDGGDFPPLQQIRGHIHRHLRGERPDQNQTGTHVYIII